MNTFDKFFTKFSYKFDKGYPDMDDPKDVLLLETLIERLIVMEFEDSENLPEDLLDLKARINALADYEVEAIQTNKTSAGVPKGTWIYLKDVGSKGRDIRRDLTIDLKDKGALPPGEVKNTDLIGAPSWLETKNGEVFVVKGAGSAFSTTTDIKEGLVIVFFNALKGGWNSSQEPFSPGNYFQLLNGVLDSSGLYEGLDSKSIKETQKKFTVFSQESASTSLAALAALNDPFSSARRLHNDYGQYKLIRDGAFNSIRSAARNATGIDADKWNPGDIYIQTKSDYTATKEETDAMPWGKLNELFEGQWGETGADFVAVSLKQQKAQGGKAKGFLKNLNPDLLPADGDNKPLPPIYGLSKDEMQNGYDFDTALDSYKSTVVNKLGNQEFIDFKIGKNPPTIQQKKFKLAAYKALDYLITWFKDKAGETNPVTALVKMAAYGMSISGVNPTYFKLIGKTDGSTADIPEKFPAGATAKLTPGTKIKIYDGDNNGALIIDMNVDIMVGDDKVSQYDLKISARSNGGDQNTIEISKAKKK